MSSMERCTAAQSIPSVLVTGLELCSRARVVLAAGSEYCDVQVLLTLLCMTMRMIEDHYDCDVICKIKYK